MPEPEQPGRKCRESSPCPVLARISPPRRSAAKSRSGEPRTGRARRHRPRSWRGRSGSPASFPEAAARWTSSSSSRTRRHDHRDLSRRREHRRRGRPSSGSSTSRPTAPSSGATPIPRRARSRGPNGEVIEDASQPMEVYLEGNVDPPPGREQGGRQRRPEDLPREAGLLRLPDRPVRRPRRRDRHVRPGLDRADEAQVAADRAVPPADAAARRHARARREPGDPGRADDDDRQPVPEPGLPDQQPVGRPDPQDAGRSTDPNSGTAGRRPERPRRPART